MATKTTDAPQASESLTGLYEVMLILNPDLRENEAKKRLKEFEEFIQKAGGKIAQEDFWGKKSMAYRIKNFSEGYYMVYILELPAAFLAELRQHLRIEKEVLRSLILGLPADYVYTKYDLTAPEKKEERPKRFTGESRNVSVKHNAPVTPAKKKEAEPEKKKPAKEVDESALEKKLDEIIGGGDLNL